MGVRTRNRKVNAARVAQRLLRDRHDALPPYAWRAWKRGRGAVARRRARARDAQWRANEALHCRCPAIEANVIDGNEWPCRALVHVVPRASSVRARAASAPGARSEPASRTADASTSKEDLPVRAKRSRYFGGT